MIRGKKPRRAGAWEAVMLACHWKTYAFVAVGTLGPLILSDLVPALNHQGGYYAKLGGALGLLLRILLLVQADNRTKTLPPQ